MASGGRCNRSFRGITSVCSNVFRSVRKGVRRGLRSLTGGRRSSPEQQPGTSQGTQGDFELNPSYDHFGPGRRRSSIEHDFKCQICYNDYSLVGDHKPCGLICGHSMCMECALKICGPDKMRLESPREFLGLTYREWCERIPKCPFCRKQLRRHRLSSLPINFSVLSALQKRENEMRQTGPSIRGSSGSSYVYFPPVNEEPEDEDVFFEASRREEDNQGAVGYSSRRGPGVRGFMQPDERSFRNRFSSPHANQSPRYQPRDPNFPGANDPCLVRPPMANSYVHVSPFDRFHPRTTQSRFHNRRPPIPPTGIRR